MQTKTKTFLAAFALLAAGALPALAVEHGCTPPDDLGDKKNGGRVQAAACLTIATPTTSGGPMILTPILMGK